LTFINGKLFVQFIALIYLSYVKKGMQDAGLFKQHGRMVGEMTKKQQEIYTALGVKPPSL